MSTNRRIRTATTLVLLMNLYCGAPALCGAPVHGVQVLEAADHAELEAEISTTALNRIALEHDRVSRVIGAPPGLVVEHDPVRGDIYLKFGASTGPGLSDSGATAPSSLYLGTERGLTYQVTLAVTERGPAQILIRNAGLDANEAAGCYDDTTQVGELLRLVRAVARREPLPGYSIVVEPAAATAMKGPRPIESWRGRRWTARVLAVPDGFAWDAPAMAAQHDGQAVAAWVSENTRGPGGGRMAVIVEDSHAPGMGR